MNVVESDATAENACLVGDFSRALLYDRETTTLSVGTVNDDFVRNIVRVLGELRAGFGVVRPSAFCRVTLSA
jgi:HK97 family phage major capsid protein